MEIKPFIKWAGGKGQLINEITKHYPFNNYKIDKYVEPFVGGGAILFDILNKYEIKEIYISDINESLIKTYIAIRDNSIDLINYLKKLEEEYLNLNEIEQKEYYLNKRKEFNEQKLKNNTNSIYEASLLIFLNKTCFNGLYRVNRKGEFNVPFGKHKKPKIYIEENIINISNKLKKVKIVRASYKDSLNIIDENTFVYLDPPYRPITKTASFTSYNNVDFNDDDQRELKLYIDEVNKKGAKFLLSNSDPKNTNEKDNFFDDLYKDYKIKRIEVNRMISSNGKTRGKIKEILVSNYL